MIINRRKFLAGLAGTAVAGKVVATTPDVPPLIEIKPSPIPKGYSFGLAPIKAEGTSVAYGYRGFSDGYLDSDFYCGIWMKYYRWVAPEDIGDGVFSYKVSARMIPKQNLYNANLQTYALGKKVTAEALEDGYSPIEELGEAMKRTIDFIMFDKPVEGICAIHKPEGSAVMFI